MYTISAPIFKILYYLSQRVSSRRFLFLVGQWFVDELYTKYFLDITLKYSLFCIYNNQKLFKIINTKQLM